MIIISNDMNKLLTASQFKFLIFKLANLVKYDGREWMHAHAKSTKIRATLAGNRNLSFKSK